ncbi:helix-turn-helix transcriptional regulator [Flavobacterium alvei]|mgnify:CR=1 FL=1|uniref:ArsR/SmtB family transcription factor n=1 Tax=Flavobacterium alvei TaxID=2080416 RepID=UPI0026EEAFE6|nr:winged helix-turn-helix domain-containing protein [Flavobacterium alvei]
MPNTFKPNYFTAEQEQTARFAKALGHPVRIAILQLLDNQTCCYHGDMAEELPIAKSTLSQHLNELKDAGLIKGNITPPTIKYCINRENWNLAIRLLNGIMTPDKEHNVAVVKNPEQLIKT